MFLEPAPSPQENGPRGSKVLAFAAYFLFWLTFSAVGLWLILALRELVVDLMIRAGLNPFTVRGFDRLGIYALGLLWFVVVLWSEHTLRTSIRKRQLWRMIGRLALAEAIVSALVLGTGAIV
jgi:hypothetical protein